jgi:hypothetical protein
VSAGAAQPAGRGGLRARLALVLLVLLLLGAGYTWLTLSWEYSNGERAGVLQKFSRKGWLCKTYEGELAMYVVAGVQPEIWYFSVREESLAHALSAAVGQRVQLHYGEHRGVPTSCFAETGYFVDRINTIGESKGAPVIAAPVQ